MKALTKIALILALALGLSACTETVGGLALIGTAVTGLISSGSANPDYTKYADTCKEIVKDIMTLQTAKYTAIGKAIDSKNAHVQGGAMVMMAYENQQMSGNMLQRCSIQGPESFLQTLFKNANVPNFLLALYQENRADSRAQRQMELSKQLSLANMQHQENMQDKENSLLEGLAGRPTENFNAGAAAATPAVVPGAE